MHHPLFDRQLRRCGIDPETGPQSEQQWARLRARIDRAYAEADDTREVLERALPLSSEELLEQSQVSRTAEALHVAERDRLQAVLQGLREGLCMIDPNGSCTMLNPEAERLLGFREAELLGKPLLDLFIDPLGLAVAVEVTDADGVFRRKDGRPLPVSYTLSRIEIAGRPVGSVLVFRDASERRRRVEFLEREHGDFLRLIEHAPVAMAMFDCEMRYLALSQRWRSDYQLDDGEVIGRSHYDVFVDQPLQWREIHRAAMRGQVLTNLDDVIVLDGVQVHMRWAAQPWHTANGDIGGIVMVSDRIDDLVHAREAALQAAKLKADFLASMSHEIRTPMNGVIGTMQLLSSSELDPSQRELVQTMEGSADDLLRIINDILDFSKLEAHKLVLERVEFDLRELVAEVMERLAESARHKSLELAFLVTPNVPQLVRGDPGRVKQVLSNLVSNAIKFTEVGEVVVRVKLQATLGSDVELRFEVEDTGIGLPEDAQGKLFDAFSQADDSIARRFGGTGLGLAICKQLVALMDGEIGVYSIRGWGSTFWFSARFAPGAGAPTRWSASPPELENCRVLVGHGRPIIRRTLEEKLQNMGLQVTLAADLEQVVAHLARAETGTKFDIALVDEGLISEESSALRERAESASIVITSSRGSNSEHDDGFAARLVKPVRESRLIECFAEVLEVSLPQPESAEQPEKPGIVPLDGAAECRILLAEDHPVNRTIAVRMLERLGFAVDVAADGREALDATERIGYDLVLMDCQMPELDGLEATRALRERERGGSRLPIIALTANAMPDDRQRCLDAGMDDYLTKPVRVDDLERALVKWTSVRARD